MSVCYYMLRPEYRTLEEFARLKRFEGIRSLYVGTLWDVSLLSMRRIAAIMEMDPAAVRRAAWLWRRIMWPHRYEWQWRVTGIAAEPSVRVQRCREETLLMPWVWYVIRDGTQWGVTSWVRTPPTSPPPHRKVSWRERRK